MGLSGQIGYIWWRNWWELLCQMNQTNLGGDWLHLECFRSNQCMQISWMNGQVPFRHKYFWKLKVSLKIRIFMWFYAWPMPGRIQMIRKASLWLILTSRSGHNFSYVLAFFLQTVLKKISARVYSGLGWFSTGFVSDSKRWRPTNEVSDCKPNSFLNRC